MSGGKDDGQNSRELCLNDQNSCRDSRITDESTPYDTVQYAFAKGSPANSSGEPRSFDDLEPFETVKKLGADMSTLFANWSQEFMLSKKFEEEAMKKMDNLKKQAYVQEAAYLESKLEFVKKRITET